MSDVDIRENENRVVPVLELLESLSYEVGENDQAQAMIAQLNDQLEHLCDLEMEWMAHVKESVEKMKVVMYAAIDERDTAIKKHVQLEHDVKNFYQTKNQLVRNLIEEIEANMMEMIGQSDHWEAEVALRDLLGWAGNDANILAYVLNPTFGESILTEPEVYMPLLRKLLADMESVLASENGD